MLLNVIYCDIVISLLTDLISEVENPRKSVSESPDTNILLTWGMPQNLLGNPVNNIRFKVEYCRKSSAGNLKYGCVTTQASGTSIELTNLIPATEYIVTVRAASPAGLLGVPSVMTVATGKSFLNFFFLLSEYIIRVNRVHNSTRPHYSSSTPPHLATTHHTSCNTFFSLKTFHQLEIVVKELEI